MVYSFLSFYFFTFILFYSSSIAGESADILLALNLFFYCRLFVEIFFTFFYSTEAKKKKEGKMIWVSNDGRAFPFRLFAKIASEK